MQGKICPKLELPLPGENYKPVPAPPVHSTATGIFRPGSSGRKSFDYLTPMMTEAELLAGLLSLPLKATCPMVDMVPVALNVTFTVTIMV